MNAAAYLAQVTGIDAILAGHAHLVFPSPSFATLPGVDIARGTIHGVPTVMAGFWGSHLGVVDLTLRRTADGWRRVDGTGTTRANRAVTIHHADGRVEAHGSRRDARIRPAVRASRARQVKETT